MRERIGSLESASALCAERACTDRSLACCFSNACQVQMLKHRRNSPPGYTKRDLDEVDTKALELIALIKEHWEPYQKSGFKTIKARHN